MVGNVLKVGENEIDKNVPIEEIPSSNRGISYNAGDGDMHDVVSIKLMRVS